MAELKKLFKSYRMRKLARYFLLLFFLPFVLITVTILSSLFSSFGQQMAYEQLSLTVQAMDHAQGWLANFNRMVTQLVSDDTFHPEELVFYSEQNLLQKRLQLLAGGQSGLANIWYPLPSGSLISGTDVLSIKRLNEDRFTANEPDPGDEPIYTRLFMGEVLSVRDRYVGRNYLLIPYFFQTLQNRELQTEMLIFQVDQQVFLKELEALWNVNPGRVRLRARDGRVILSSDHDCAEEFSVAAACTDSTNAPYTTLSESLGSIWRPHSVIACSVAAYHWAIDFVGVSNLLGRFHVIQLVMLLLIAVFVLGCGVCALCVARLYKPLRSLRDSLNDAAMPQRDCEYGDAYDYIESSIECIRADNEQMRQQLAQHTKIAREFVVTMLLAGKIRDLEEYLGTYAFCGYFPENERHIIEVIDCASAPAQIAALMAARAEAAAFALRQDTRCTLYWPDGAWPHKEAEAGFSSISGPHENWRGLPEHCAQAWFARSLRRPQYSDGLLKEAIEQAREMAVVFQAALTAKNTKPLEEFARQIPPERLYAHACALAACLLRWLADKDYSIIEDVSIFYVPYAATPGEQRNALCGLVSFLSTLLQAENSSETADEETDVLEQIYQYIAQEYASPNFSIKQMASDLHMSISALSSYFKNRTGQLLSDYITEMKMKKASHLLAHSNLSVQEIALAVGYFNANSFIRRFHQMKGMSPREFRNMHRA